MDGCIKCAQTCHWTLHHNVDACFIVEWCIPPPCVCGLLADLLFHHRRDADRKLGDYYEEINVGEERAVAVLLDRPVNLLSHIDALLQRDRHFQELLRDTERFSKDMYTLVSEDWMAGRVCLGYFDYKLMGLADTHFSPPGYGDHQEEANCVGVCAQGAVTGGADGGRCVLAEGLHRESVQLVPRSPKRAL